MSQRVKRADRLARQRERFGRTLADMDLYVMRGCDRNDFARHMLDKYRPDLQARPGVHRVIELKPRGETP